MYEVAFLSMHKQIHSPFIEHYGDGLCILYGITLYIYICNMNLVFLVLNIVSWKQQVA